MTNVFDQFDAPLAHPVPDNVFNQFDDPAQSGSGLGDVARFAGTSVIRGLGGLINFASDPFASLRSLVSPDLEQIEKQHGPGTEPPPNSSIPSAMANVGGVMAAPGTAAGDQAFNLTGLQEAKPSSELGRVGLAGAEGAIAGGPFGLTAAGLSALAAALGQGTGDLTGSHRLATAASLLPGLLAKPVDMVRQRMLPPETQAVNTLASDVSRSAAAGGPDIDAMRNALAGSSKPLALADVGGVNVQGRGEAIANTPGQGAQIAEDFLRGRDAGAGPRLLGDMNSAFGAGPSAFKTAQDLSQLRAQTAAPLYQKAFEGGSIAPLESSLTSLFNEASAASQRAAKDVAAAQQAATNAAAKTATAGNVYSSSAASSSAKDATTQLMEARQRAAQADQFKQTVLQKLQEAQSHAANGVPGAVWSPRIQQFLDDPIIQQGIREGLTVQRLESLAAGAPFNPKEYAITGTDDVGQPIVSGVPNMRLLDAGKRGLDNMLDQYRDPASGRLVLDQRGRAIDQVRQSYLQELDNLNPDYAAARQAWSGPSQSMTALKMGGDIFNQQPEQISENIGRLSDSDKQFFLLGARDALAQRIAKTSAGGNEALRIVGNQHVQNQLQPLFPDDQSFNAFIGQAQLESLMYRTMNNTLGNSRTFRRAAMAAGDGGEGNGLLAPAVEAAGISLMHPAAALPAWLRVAKGIGSRLAGPAQLGPEAQAAMARMLFSSDPAANAATLNSLAQTPGPRLPFSLAPMIPAGMMAGEQLRLPPPR